MGQLKFQLLEPRVLLDAAGAMTIAAEADSKDTPSADHSENSGSVGDLAPALQGILDQSSDSGRIIVALDMRVEGAAEFAALLPDGVELVQINGDEHGVSVLADALENGPEVSQLHIFSHGGAGLFHLGADRVDAQSLTGGLGESLGGWKGGLSAGADILIYGCDVAAGPDGEAFVRALSDLTGADIAASSDATGSAALGGDFDLEVSVGTIEASLPADAHALDALSELLAAPTISNSASTPSVSEDSPATFTGITVADGDNDTLNVTIHVTDTSGTATTGTDLGTLTLASTANISITSGSNGGSSVTIRGLAADINTALNGLTVNLNQNFNGTARLALLVDDGGATDTLNASIIVKPVNDNPALTPSTITVAEGGTKVIVDTNFGLVDAELNSGGNDQQVAQQEVFKLTAVPTHGTLKLNGFTMIVGGTFSLADVQANRLTYVHDGSDIVTGSNDTDSFNVTINDGAGSGDIGPTTINITLTPVNAAPSVSGTPSVYEGQGTEVVWNNSSSTTTPAQIGSALTVSGNDADPADAQANLAIRISNVNNDGDGTLFFDANNNGVLDSGEAITETTGVLNTTADQLGKLLFVHDGGEPSGTGPSFDIRVTDGGGGEGAGAALSATATITISVTANDDNPVLAQNTGTAVNAGGSVVINNGDLQVTDVDDTSSGSLLTYTVTRVPTFGEIRLNNEILGVGGRFTQADIDAGNITYNQTATVDDPDDAGPQVVTDSFDFEVRDSKLRTYNASGNEGAIRNADGTIAENTFTIDISGDNTTGTGPGSPAAGRSGTIVVNTETNTGLTGANAVTEDDGVYLGVDTKVIDNTKLFVELQSNDGAVTFSAAETVFRLTSLPSNGFLSLNGTRLALYGTFTQADINNNLLSYTHDGGETHFGSFTFSVTAGNADSFSRTFNLEAIPSNDAPTVSGGAVPTVAEGGTVRIPSSAVGLSDVDTANETGEPTGEAKVDDLFFRVTTLPTHGTLERWNGTGWVAVSTDDLMSSSILTTSADGATSGLRYIHDGTENFSDSFQFDTRDDLTKTGTAFAIFSQTTQGAAAANNLSGTATATLSIAPLNDRPIADADYTTNDATSRGGLTTVNQLLSVNEGSINNTISNAYLVAVDPDSDTINRQFRITTDVAHGTLKLNGKALGVGSVFTQDDIDNNRVTYDHDGSDFASDFFRFIVSDSVADHEQTPGGTVAASRFDIVVPQSGIVNDIPTITTTTSSVNATGTPASNPISLNGIFTLGDTDLDESGVAAGETDFVQITVVLKDSGNNAVDLSGTGGISVPAGVTETNRDLANGTITFQGTMANVRSALNGLSVTLPDGDHNSTFTITASINDQLRDGSGTVTGGANGDNDGTVNSNGSTINAANNTASASITIYASDDNDPPVLTVPGTQSTYEDVTHSVTGLSISDVDAFNNSLTVTLSVTNGTIAATGSGVSNSGTTTVTITGTVSAINTALGTVTYTGNANFIGSDTLNITVNDGGNLGSGGAQTDTGSVSITVAPLNDAPTVSRTSSAITVSSPGAFAVSGFSVSDLDIDGSDGGISAGETDFVQVTVRILNQSSTPLSLADYGTYGITINSTTPGTATVDGTESGVSKALTIRGTRAEVNTYLAGLQVDLGTQTETDNKYKVQVIVDDRVRVLATGALDGSSDANGGRNPNSSTPASVTGGVAVPTTAVDPYGALPTLAFNVASATRDIFLSSVNDPADVTGNNFSINEGSSTVVLNASNANFTVADPDDNGGTMSATVTVSQGTITAVGSSGGTVSNLGTASITITGATEAQLNARLKAITVALPDPDGAGAATAQDFNGAINVTVVVNDGGNTGQRPGSLTGDTNDATANPGDYAYADGVSSNLVTTRTIVMTVNPTNDAPVLTGTSANPALVVNDDGSGTTSSAALITGATAFDIDILTDGDVNSFGGGTLTVTFTDGFQTGDRLTVNGGVLAGMNGAATGGSGAALVINLANDATEAQVAAIIEAIRYTSVDADPTANGADPTRAYSITLNDGNNNNDGGATNGVNDAGGPTTLNSNALTGTITFRLPPTAVNDTGAVTKLAPTTTGNALTNDSDPEHAANPGGEAAPTVTAVAGAGGNVGTAVTGTYGTLTLNANGTYSYTADTNNTSVKNLLPGDPALTDTFTYEITDNDGQKDTATITISITGTNTAPTARDNSGTVQVVSKETETGNVVTDNDGSGVDSDPEGQTLTVTAVNGGGGNVGNGVAGTYGTVTINANGTYTYVLNNTNPTVVALGPDATLTDTFTYTITDGTNTDTANLVITIGGKDTPPVATDNSGTVQVASKETETGNVISDDDGNGVDTDPEGETLTVVAVNGGGGGVGNGVVGTYGTVTINPDGSYTYVLDVNNPTVRALGPDATLTDTFTYTVSEGDNTATANLVITIGGKDAPPVATDNEGSVQVGVKARERGNVITDNDGNGVDSDPEGEALTVIEINATGGTVGTTITGQYGTLVVNANGGYTYELNEGNRDVQRLEPGDSLQDTFTYTITEGDNNATANLIITIEGPEPPAAAPPPPPEAPTPPPPPPPTAPPGGGGTPGGPPTTRPGFSNPALEQGRRALTGGLDLRSPQINPITLTLDLPDRVVESGVQNFNIPESAFDHTDPSADISVAATLSDGSSLPSFITFDPQNLLFTVDADAARAAGEIAVDIRVTGEDHSGNAASTVFTVRFTEGIAAGRPAQGQPVPGQQAPGQDGGNAGQQDTAGGQGGQPGDGQTGDGQNAAQPPEGDGTAGTDQDGQAALWFFNEFDVAELDAGSNYGADDSDGSRPDIAEQARATGRHGLLAARNALAAELTAFLQGA